MEQILSRAILPTGDVLLKLLFVHGSLEGMVSSQVKTESQKSLKQQSCLASGLPTPGSPTSAGTEGPGHQTPAAVQPALVSPGIAGAFTRRGNATPMTWTSICERKWWSGKSKAWCVANILQKRKQKDRVHLHDLVVPSPTFYDLAVPSPTFYDLVVPSPTFYDLVVPSPTQDILNLVDDYLVVSSGIWFFYDLMGPESKSEPWFVESHRVEPWHWGQASSKLRTTCTCQWQSNPKGPTKVDNIENLIL
jgi:hypothetical protein